MNPASNILNVIINIKDKNNILFSAGDPEADRRTKQLEILRDNKQSRPINLVNYVVNLMKDQKKNNDYIKFFRAICAYTSRAVQVNQEILYKIFQNEFFRNIAFIHTKIQKRKMGAAIEERFNEEMWIKFSVRDQNWVRLEDCKV
jgi:hypothetical protein